MRAEHAPVYGAVLGYACDLVAGDPRRGHPVAAFGRAAAAVERRLWHDHRAYGALHTALRGGPGRGGGDQADHCGAPSAGVSWTGAAVSGL
ncbi:cobalamin biosynthesis protein, partial [Streptomyces pathocidini]